MVSRAWGRTNEELLTKDQKALVKVSTMSHSLEGLEDLLTGWPLNSQMQGGCSLVKSVGVSTCISYQQWHSLEVYQALDTQVSRQQLSPWRGWSAAADSFLKSSERQRDGDFLMHSRQQPSLSVSLINKLRGILMKRSLPSKSSRAKCFQISLAFNMYLSYLSIPFILWFIYCSTESCTYDLVHGRQILYHWSITPAEMDRTYITTAVAACNKWYSSVKGKAQQLSTYKACTGTSTPQKKTHFISAEKSFQLSCLRTITSLEILMYPFKFSWN